MPLRATARACGISLDTLFHLRHRIMELLQGEQAELLQGIVELDETFFRESHKGSRHQPFQRASQKRRGVRKKVLDYMWWEEIESCLVGRIAPDTPVCADALAQHDRVAERLGFVLKTLVTTEGQTIRQGVFPAPC